MFTKSIDIGFDIVYNIYMEPRLAKSEARLAKITETLESGFRVQISTHLKSWLITPKSFQSWKKSGRQLFKIGSDGGLYMARGKSYDCIDYCGFSYERLAA